jgi:hypothetical protein
MALNKLGNVGTYRNVVIGMREKFVVDAGVRGVESSRGQLENFSASGVKS